MMRAILVNRHNNGRRSAFPDDWGQHESGFSFHGATATNDVARAALWYVHRRSKYWEIDPKT